MGGAAVAALVGFVRFVEAGGAGGGFLAGQVAEAVIFSFGVLGLVVVECWDLLVWDVFLWGRERAYGGRLGGTFRRTF